MYVESCFPISVDVTLSPDISGCSEVLEEGHPDGRRVQLLGRLNLCQYRFPRARAQVNAGIGVGSAVDSTEERR